MKIGWWISFNNNWPLWETWAYFFLVWFTHVL